MNWKPLLFIVLFLLLGRTFGAPNLIDTISNYQVTFSMPTIRDKKLDLNAIKKISKDWLRRQPGITYAIDMDKVGESPVAALLHIQMPNGWVGKPITQVLHDHRGD